MKRFSERIGAVDRPAELQIDRMSTDLRNSLWNVVHSIYQPNPGGSTLGAQWRDAAIRIAVAFRKVPVDDVPAWEEHCRTWLKSYFFGLKWYEVYDLMEFILNVSRQPGVNTGLEERLNGVLERELSGYRVVAGVLTPIATPVEAETVEEAMAAAETHGLQGAHEHLRTALRSLGRRPEPDYRNSIKESISAVESVAKVISGETGGGLDSALTRLAKIAGIHGALRSGFLSLYGYSSDEDGIRHAILDEPNVGYAEAKYMLVACSAFVGYLITKADAAGLLKKD